MNLYPFKRRPTEILARTGANVQILPGAVTHVANAKDPRIGVGAEVTAGIGPQCHAARVAQSERPDPRPGCARIGRVIKWIAWNTVARRRVEPHNFAAQAVHQLRSVGAHVLLWFDNAIAQSLGVVRLRRAANVIGRVTRPVTARSQQGSVGSKHQRPDAVRFVEDWKAGAFRLPQQDAATGVVHRLESVG